MNKKIMLVGVIALAVIAGIVIFFSMKKGSDNAMENISENAEVGEEKYDSPDENKDANGNNPPIEVSEQKNQEEPVEKTEEEFVTEYENGRYAFTIKFPDGWYMNNDYSESEMRVITDENGAVKKVGGQTFWSNYENMNDYSPSNKPNDFHMLALSIYEDESGTIEEFAKKLEFDEDAKKKEFQADGVKGVEFISAGLVPGNPRVAVMFKRDKLIYVFNIAFIGGDTKAAGVMEGIVETFSLK